VGCLAKGKRWLRHGVVATTDSRSPEGGPPRSFGTGEAFASSPFGGAIAVPTAASANHPPEAPTQSQPQLQHSASCSCFFPHCASAVSHVLLPGRAASLPSKKCPRFSKTIATCPCCSELPWLLAIPQYPTYNMAHLIQGIKDLVRPSPSPQKPGSTSKEDSMRRLKRKLDPYDDLEDGGMS
jgi:hypothetical protein